MTDEWRELKCSEIVVDRGLVGGPFGSSLVSSDYTESGIPVIRGVNLPMDKRFDISGLAYVSLEKFETDLARNEARPGDVIVTQRGTLGQVGVVPDGPHDKYVVSQSQMRIRTDSSVALPSFVYYAFRDWSMVAQIKQRAIATGVPHINLGILGDLRVTLPPIEVQRQIVRVLGALDDKIDVNRSIIRLMQDRMRLELSTLGNGERMAIGSVAKLIRQSVKPETVPAETPYIGLEHMPQGDIALANCATAGAVGSSKSRFTRGDVLFGKLRPYFNKVGVAQFDGICSSDILVIRPKEDVWRPWLALTLSSPAVIDHATAVASGTRMPRAKWSDLETYEAPAPDSGTFKPWAVEANQQLEFIASLSRQNVDLVATRDMLLPKLLSGELRVGDAEGELEEAGV